MGCSRMLQARCAPAPCSKSPPPPTCPHLLALQAHPHGDPPAQPSLTTPSPTPRLPAVVLACRSRAKGDALKADIEASCAERGLPRAEVEVRLLDLATLE